MVDLTIEITQEELDTAGEAGAKALMTTKFQKALLKQDVSMEQGKEANSQLKSLVERIEQLEDDKAEVANDIKEVYAEAKANGYDVKILRKVISARKKTRDELMEEDAITDLYMSNLGMI